MVVQLMLALALDVLARAWKIWFMLRRFVSRLDVLACTLTFWLALLRFVLHFDILACASTFWLVLGCLARTEKIQLFHHQYFLRFFSRATAPFTGKCVCVVCFCGREIETDRQRQT